MIDVLSLTDDELATCVDEYMKRAMRVANEVNVQRAVYVMASCCDNKTEYEIDHKAELGPYNKEIKINSNNAIHGMRRALGRHIDDLELSPTKVQPMLPAPAPTPVHEYHEFEEVKEDADNDPF